MSYEDTKQRIKGGINNGKNRKSLCLYNINFCCGVDIELDISRDSRNMEDNHRYVLTNEEGYNDTKGTQTIILP